MKVTENKICENNFSPAITDLVILVERNGETVGNIQYASFFETSEKNTDDTFDVTNFAGSVEMIDDAEQHQRVDHDLRSSFDELYQI